MMATDCSNTPAARAGSVAHLRRGSLCGRAFSGRSMHLQFTLRRMPTNAPCPSIALTGVPGDRSSSLGWSGAWVGVTHSLSPPVDVEPYILKPRHDSHFGNDLCGPTRPRLRQLSECVPKPLARGRERGQAALPLPPVQPNAHLVGERAAWSVGLLLRGRCRTCHAWIGCGIRWWNWRWGCCGLWSRGDSAA